MLKQFITAGCSFTAGSSNITTALAQPTAWPHLVLPKLKPEIFVNLAIPGGGNFSIANNLVYFFQSKSYINPLETQIIFNISGLDRSDVMCPPDHPYANKNFSWTHDLGYGWLTSGGFTAGTDGPFSGLLEKNMGIDSIFTTNCLALTQAFTYLEHRGFDYAFMIMHDQVLSDSPKWFLQVLEERRSKWIQFEQSKTMNGHCIINGLLDSDQFHPSMAGHSNIADHVVKFLNLS